MTWFISVESVFKPYPLYFPNGGNIEPVTSILFFVFNPTLLKEASDSLFESSSEFSLLLGILKS